MLLPPSEIGTTDMMSGAAANQSDVTVLFEKVCISADQLSRLKSALTNATGVRNAVKTEPFDESECRNLLDRIKREQEAAASNGIYGSSFDAGSIPLLGGELNEPGCSNSVRNHHSIVEEAVFSVRTSRPAVPSSASIDGLPSTSGWTAVNGNSSLSHSGPSLLNNWNHSAHTPPLASVKVEDVLDSASDAERTLCDILDEIEIRSCNNSLLNCSQTIKWEPGINDIPALSAAPLRSSPTQPSSRTNSQPASLVASPSSSRASAQPPVPMSIDHLSKIVASVPALSIDALRRLSAELAPLSPIDTRHVPSRTTSALALPQTNSSAVSSEGNQSNSGSDIAERKACAVIIPSGVSCPVYFTSIGPVEPPNPPENSRYRKNKFSDCVGPLLYDLYQEYLENRKVWPGEIVVPEDVRIARELSARSEAQKQQEEEERQSTPEQSPTPSAPPVNIPAIFFDRVRSDVPVDTPHYNVQDAVRAMRRMMRKKMHRCKVCKNRFVEKDLFERHMKEKHPERYEKYMEEKARLEEKDRLEYLEQLERMREIEERRNKRLEYKYERTYQINQERERMGMRPLEMEEVFPPIFRRPRPPRQPSPEPEESEDKPDDTGEPAKKKFRYPRFKKAVCPQCPFCDKRYRTDAGMRKHVARKHPDCINFAQCNRCYKTVKDSDELTTHHCDLSYLCLECTPIRNMVTAERLFHHKGKFHRGELSGFLCTECNRKFLTPRKLRFHKKMEHIHTRTYKCLFCEEYFITELQVALHERIHTGKIAYDCSICDYRCARFTHLTEHKKNDHGYLCMKCGDKVMEYDELKCHTLEKHEGYLSVDCQAVLDCGFCTRENDWKKFLM